MRTVFFAGPELEPLPPPGLQKVAEMVYAAVWFTSPAKRTDGGGADLLEIVPTKSTTSKSV